MTLPDNGDTYSTSCFTLSQLLDDKDSSLSALISSMGYVLLDLFGEVRALNSKKTTRDTINKMLSERRNQPELKNVSGKVLPKRGDFVVPAQPSNSFSKRILPRPMRLASESSIEYLSAQPDMDSDTDAAGLSPSSPSFPTSTSVASQYPATSHNTDLHRTSSLLPTNSPPVSAVSPTNSTSPISTSDHLADCKSIIDTMANEKQKEEQFYSASERNDGAKNLNLGQPNLRKESLQVPPRDNMSSDSETPRPQPQVNRQTSFKRQKSFRKKKPRERPRTQTQVSVSDKETAAIPTKRQVPLVRTARSVSQQDFKSSRTLENALARRRSSDIASSDDYLNSPQLFSSDDQSGTGDTFKSMKIIDKLVLGMVNTRLRPDPIPLNFSDFESDPPDQITTKSPNNTSVLPLPEFHTRRKSMIVTTNLSCYLATSSSQPSRRFCDPINNNFVKPDIPPRQARCGTIAQSRDQMVARDQTVARDHTVSRGDELPNHNRGTEEKKNKAGGARGKQKVEQGSEQGKILTNALKSVLAFAQIKSDGK